MQNRTGFVARSLAALVAVPLLAAACGVANPFAPANAANNAEQMRLKWAQCMRQHGVNMPDPNPDGGGRWFEVVQGLLSQPDNSWWRNAKDPRGLHSRDDVLRAALDDAATELTGRLGADPTAWRWGALHQLTLTHQTLGVGGPAPVRWLFNRGPYPLPGGSAAVNANGWDARDGYAVDWGPSMRMVVDLADLDRSRWINQTGASGHAFAGNYNDQAELWASGRTVPWPYRGTAVQAATTHRLALLPANPGSRP